ncbi:MAG: hypothetical protein ACP5QW_00270 [bacterium]
MDSSNITGYCLTGSTSATCEKPIGQYITPPGTHSIDIHRCFSNNGPCCSVSSSFKFTPPVPLVDIFSPSGYIGPAGSNVSILFSDTTNKLGLNLNTYNVFIDGNSVTGSLVTQTNSTLTGFPSTPTSFTAKGNVVLNSQGTHTIQAYVTNLFYNTTGTASQTFSVDTTPPSLSFVQPISGSTSGGTSGTIFPYFIYPYITIPYEVTYNDSQSGVNTSTFNINANGVYGTVNATPISATGTLPITLPVSGGSNGTGTYVITAQVSDNVGNTGTATSVITLSLANIGIGSANVDTGTEFTIPINIFIDPSHPYGLGSYNIYVNFNQRILNFVSVSGSMSGYPGVGYSQEFSNPPGYYQTSSGVEINGYNLLGSGYYSTPVGLFNVANITFYAAYPGTTTLTIIVNSMIDTTGSALPSTRVQSGSVTVQ